MTIEECIRKTYEDLGHGVDEVTKRPDGSYSVTFIGLYGIVDRRIRILFLIENENTQCEPKKVKPNGDGNA